MNTMNKQQICIAVAECMGWSSLEAFPIDNFGEYEYGIQGIDPLGKCGEPPCYPDYLNACAEFENTLQGEVFEQYYTALFNVLNWDNKFWGKQRDLEMIRATALQRCEAYLRVKGKWEEAA